MSASASEDRRGDLTAQVVTERLRVHPTRGLSGAERERRLQQYGPIVLAEAKAEPVWRRFLRETAGSTAPGAARASA